ncbi:MAG: hypothetical protein EOO06_16095 [Chitinophagaceae bacterium]|nr:MAG: hypothetical protein EOO06_16095 [Chitinophagaceae bacterium]
MVVTRSEYGQLVLEAYKSKRKQGALSRELATGTRAKLRDACLTKSGTATDEGDEQLLREFFCEGETDRPLKPAMRTFDPDGLKALENFLKKGRGTTSEINIDLLAWLIDFPHRPYGEDKNLDLSEEEIRIVEAMRIEGKVEVKDHPGVVESPTTTTPVVSSNIAEDNQGGKIAVVIYGDPVKGVFTGTSVEAPKQDLEKHQKEKVHQYTQEQRKPSNAAVAILLVLLLAAISLFFIMDDTLQQCMVWTGERYEKLQCDQVTADMRPEPFDKHRFNNLRRITRPDTLTRDDIGKRYYIKNNNEILYFTGGGHFPEDPTRTLKKLTDRIFDTYLLGKTDSSQQQLRNANAFSLKQNTP